MIPRSRSPFESLELAPHAPGSLLFFFLLRKLGKPAKSQSTMQWGLSNQGSATRQSPEGWEKTVVVGTLNSNAWSLPVCAGMSHHTRHCFLVHHCAPVPHLSPFWAFGRYLSQSAQGSAGSRVQAKCLSVSLSVKGILSVCQVCHSHHPVCRSAVPATSHWASHAD